MEQIIDERKSELFFFVLLSLVFIGLMLFFTIVHPLYIYDTDDWTYASWYRHGLPSLRQFNPTRILPEVLMPTVSEIGAKIVYPIIGDYIGSLSFVYSVVVTLHIVLYLYFMGRVLIKETKLTWKSVAVVIASILLLHFYIVPNTHLFYGANITCYFYYIIPSLLCAIVVFYLMERESKKSIFETGVLLLAIYLCVFSNVLSSAVLMGYTAWTLLKSLVKHIGVWKKEKRSIWSRLKGFIFENAIPLFTSVIWIIAEIMEMQGSRANQISGDGLKIGEAVEVLFSYISSIRPVVLWIALVMIVISILIILKDKIKGNVTEEDRKYFRGLVRNIVCVLLVMVYLVVLCAKAGTVYLSRGDVNIDWIVFFFLILSESFAFIYKRHRKVMMLLPFAVFLLVCEIHITKYPDNWGNYNYSAKTIKALDMNIVNQVVEAERNGETSVEVYVPKYSTASNWPIPTWGGDRFSDCLYRHGITYNRMSITIVPDESINEKYHLR